MATTTNTNKTSWSVSQLKELSPEQCMELFQSLEAPTIEEMNGEYAADMLDQGSMISNTLAMLALRNPLTDGIWQCKAFQPVDQKYGHGYNSFQKSGTIHRKYPMKTSIAASRYDGRPVYQLDYTAYDSLLGTMNMVDEIRQVAPGLYLGMGTWGFTQQQRQHAYPFVLSGPDRPFVAVDEAHKQLPAKYTD